MVDFAEFTAVDPTPANGCAECGADWRACHPWHPGVTCPKQCACQSVAWTDTWLDALGEPAREFANPNTEYPNRSAQPLFATGEQTPLTEDKVKTEHESARSMSTTSIKPQLLTDIHAPMP